MTAPTQDKKVFLKPGKERLIQVNRHPWIFSGAIQNTSPEMIPGELAHVYSARGEFLAQAYFNLENSLAGRILSVDQRAIQDVMREKIQKAFFLRTVLFKDKKQTNCFRLINAEEDGLPGLIVDYYDQILVLQIGTQGMEKLKPLVVELLVQEVSPRGIYEKSTSKARQQEDLFPQEGLLYGDVEEEVLIHEHGIPLKVSIFSGQKTGFFLDQREMRKKVYELAEGLSFLNCFSYSGGFSLHALKGGARFVTSIDCCPRATMLCKKNTVLNGFSEEQHQVLEEDVFQFLEREGALVQEYDFIILDPPAFAKTRQEVESACQGYRKIHQKVLEQCKANSFLLTCSCSYFIDSTLFRQVLFQAASAAKRDVRIISKHIQAPCHPISIYHPEGEYLKSFLLWVE